jgi:hypothetical protein
LRLDYLTSFIIAANGTAGMEFAAGGETKRFRNDAWNCVQAFSGKTKARQGLEQALCVRMQRLVKQGPAIGQLDNS